MYKEAAESVFRENASQLALPSPHHLPLASGVAKYNGCCQMGRIDNGHGSLLDSYHAGEEWFGSAHSLRSLKFQGEGSATKDPQPDGCTNSQ